MSVKHLQQGLGHALILEEETLKETARLIESEFPILAAKIYLSLHKGHIPQPPDDHRYSLRKFYQLELERDEVQRVVDCLRRLEEDEAARARARWAISVQNLSRILHEWEDHCNGVHSVSSLLQPPY